MNYLVTVLFDRIQAEAAYTELEKQGLAMDKVTILGKGYQSADEFGLIDPNDMAIRQSKSMAIWLIPFGFLGGIAFSLSTGLHTFAWAGEAGNHIVGGLLGRWWYGGDVGQWGCFALSESAERWEVYCGGKRFGVGGAEGYEDFAGV
jgi:hypothetical protein